MMSRRREIAVNRQAFYNYEVLERFEAGIQLTGTEIKSIRAARVDLRGAHARLENNELWLHGMHVALYNPAGSSNHDPRRPRKLLMRRSEIDNIGGDISQKGLTLVPLKLYVKNHWAKVELGLAKGKRRYDKRKAIIERDKDREARRALRHLV